MIGLLFCPRQLFAQQRITGRLASKDSALTAATITVNGQRTATQTDANGNFPLWLQLGKRWGELIGEENCRMPLRRIKTLVDL